MNDVMKILKEESAGQSDQKFNLECSIKINFRLSSGDRTMGRLSRVDGLKLIFLKRK
jgi:hypothetical protein